MPGDRNPFRYCGEFWDSDAGTYYLRARNYDQTIGRFLSEDTHWNVGNMIYGDREYGEGEKKVADILAINQAFNLYAYCLNNSVRYIDSIGLAVYATGISAEAGVGWYASGQLLYVWDDHGNKAIIALLDVGGGVGAGAGLTGFKFPTMDNIWQLKNQSVTVHFGAGPLGYSYLVCGKHQSSSFSLGKGKIALGYSGTTTVATWFIWTW